MVDKILNHVHECFHLDCEEQFALFIAGSFARNEVRFKGDEILSDLECVVFIDNVNFKKVKSQCEKTVVRINNAKIMIDNQLVLEVDYIRNAEILGMLHIYEAIGCGIRLGNGRLHVDSFELDKRSLLDIKKHRILNQFHYARSEELFKIACNKDMSDYISYLYHINSLSQGGHLKTKRSRLNMLYKQELISAEMFESLKLSLNGKVEFESFKSCFLKWPIRFGSQSTLLCQPQGLPSILRLSFYITFSWIFRIVNIYYNQSLRKSSNWSEFHTKIMFYRILRNLDFLFYSYLKKC